MLNFSCSTDDESIKNEPDAIKVEDGILVFKNRNHFIEFRESLKNKDKEYLDSWEQSIDFTSFRNLMTKAIDIYQSTERLSSDYSDLFIEGDILTPNIPSYELSKIINKEGIVKVDGKYYQYTKDYLKVILNGDKSQFERLGKIQTSEDGIFVSKIRTESKTFVDGRQQEFLTGCFAVAPSPEKYALKAREHYTIIYDEFSFTELVFEVRVITTTTLPATYPPKVSEYLKVVGSATANHNLVINQTVYNTGLHFFSDWIQIYPGDQVVLYQRYWDIYAKSAISSTVLNCEIAEYQTLPLD
jgi:hypothetical protein